MTIAQVFLNKPETRNDPAFRSYYEEENRDFAPYLFYGNFFMEGKSAFVPRRNIDLFEVLKKAPRTGGVPVLAHPGAYFQKVRRDDLVRLREKGLEGIEVYTSYHNPKQTELYRKMSEDLQLVPTAGSDFHGAIKPQIPFGFLTDGGYWMVEELRKRRP